MRNRFAIALALILALVALPAKADTVDQDTVTLLRSELTKQQVNPDVQDLLIAKYEAGEPWDSMSPGKEPVTVEHTEGVTRETFADGSLIITTVDQPRITAPGEVTPFASVSGCKGTSQISSVKYTGCKVEQNSIFLKMGFYFDYSVPVKGTSVITNARSWYNFVLMGNASNNTLSLPTSNRAKYSADITSSVGFSWGGTSIGGSSQANVYLMVIVEGHGVNTIVG